jgi:hypothetical protein
MEVLNLLPLVPTLEHRADFSVSWSFTDGRTPWTSDQLVAWSLPKHRTTQTQKNAHTYQTSMPWTGFELTIPASERAKTVHALDRSATVTGWGIACVFLNLCKRRVEWVTGFTVRPLIPEKGYAVRLDRRLSGRLTRVPCGSKEDVMYSCQESNPGFGNPIQ